jgi:regulator of protease activity HflC (stomatin/prohibitin superfamily)
MKKPQISKLAITSLITGLLFFIPIITGLMALLFGSLSIKAINKDKTFLLGKGLAFAGLLLGLLNVIAWSFILFNNPIYFIEPNQEAVVFREKQQKHVVKPGLHFLNPIIERVKIYDPLKVYSSNTGEHKYHFSNGEPINLNTTYKWRICEPMENADNFLGLDDRVIEEAITKAMVQAVRQVLLEENVNDPKRLESQMFHDAIRRKVDSMAMHYGVCLATFLDNDRGLKFIPLAN